MRPIDISALHSAINETAATMLSEGETTPESFVRRFRSGHSDLVAEYTDFLINQQLAKLVGDLTGGEGVPEKDG